MQTGVLSSENIADVFRGISQRRRQGLLEINSPDEAKYYLDLGVRHFCIGTDLIVLYQWMKNNGEALRKVVEGA